VLTYYNDFDPFACEWIRGLIKAKAVTPGHIDERSIKDVQPADVVRFQRVHFFAGVAGWDHALNLAGWTGPVWTGSCPCQPFSAAGKRKGKDDERHLWPEFFRLIRECKPSVIFGEQVASKDGLGWLDGVFADLEGAGYACGAADLCAAGINSPHIRQRLFWVAYASSTRAGRDTGTARGTEAKGGRERVANGLQLGDALVVGGSDGRLGIANGKRFDREQVSILEGRSLQARLETSGAGGASRLEYAPSNGRDQGREREPGGSGASIGMGNTEGQRERESDHQGDTIATGGETRAVPSGASPWDAYRIVYCTDGKARRISAQSGDEPLAYGLPRKVGQGSAELAGLDRVAAKAKLRELRNSLKRAKRNRVGRLKGYGNAIVPQVAAEFVRAFMESRIIEAQGAGA
jgi:DNA (cytosine-5)-methyltransferase 1